VRYAVKETKRFRRDRRRCIRRGLPQEELDAVVLTLAAGEELEPKFRDHALKGALAGFRECHIRPDWLLVYLKVETVLVLSLQRTGTHAELLEK
jgi:mRNA interferase YafQ